MRAVLAIDPGSEKCGLAVANRNRALHKEVARRADVVRVATALASRHEVEEIIIGNGTGGGSLIEEIRAAISLPISVVDEAYSSERARKRFFEENPPRGIRRFIPRGLLTPDRPYDDYVALILAEDYLAGQST